MKIQRRLPVGTDGDIFGFTAEEVAGLAREAEHEDRLEEIKVMV